MDKHLQIRNSTTDFLVFTKQNSQDSIQVRVRNENVWLTQKAMAQLFDCSVDNIGLHYWVALEEYFCLWGIGRNRNYREILGSSK